MNCCAQGSALVLPLRHRPLLLFCAVALLAARPAHAIRTNAGADLAQLVAQGRFAEALFYRQSSLTMVLAVHAAWAGVIYDERMDGLYNGLDRLYNNHRDSQHEGVEPRLDRRYWSIVFSQMAAIDALRPQARLTPAQEALLALRVRVYVEDHLAPEFGDMGNFFFLPKARILEQTGLLYDAAFRRELAAQYLERVAAPYYHAVALECQRSGDAAGAAAYGARAAELAAQVERELRRANGDSLLSQRQGGDPRARRWERAELVTWLTGALTATEPDARLAAALVLGDLGEFAALRAAGASLPADLRGLVPGEAPPPPGGLRPGLLATYRRDPADALPLRSSAIANVDLGFRGNERFPAVLRPFWPKDEVFPADATGPFYLSITGQLLVPQPGDYRFYVKTEGDHRAAFTLTLPGQAPVILIAPKDDCALRYADQRGPKQQTLFRIDFSEPVALPAGPVDLRLEYWGRAVNGPNGLAGLRLMWSSDRAVMSTIPAAVFAHRSPP